VPVYNYIYSTVILLPLSVSQEPTVFRNILTAAIINKVFYTHTASEHLKNNTEFLQ